MHQTTTYFYLLLLLAISFCTQAENHCPESLAEVISFQGKVDIQNRNQNNWKPLTKDYIFCYGDKVRTSKNSRATLKIKNESRTTLNQNSTLTFSVHNKKELSNENLLKFLIKIFNGSALFRSRYTQSLEVETPWVNYAHKGTEFMVTVDSQQSKATVFDGQVAAINSMGEKLIEKGYIGIAGKNQAPRIQALTIHPEDAVQWTLYYPTIIDYQSVDTHDDASLQSSINANLQNNPYKALTLMEAIPASQQNADYLTLKASLLLIFGSVEEAKNLINKSLVLESDNSTAIALQSIIAVTKNRQDKALNLAKKAVEHDPQSAVAQIALSYAYQSKFDIESALKATNEAIQLSPDNALAWARLSELQLSTGERSDALKSAEKAKELNPKLARTQTILGFASLAQVETDQAKIAFNQAINLDSADPLARLGLGLAKIRKGDIEEGTSDIETAVSLDPDNSIMRSYLGKAYYELKNDDYAATELAIAKEKDPKDPTPWFYDAIRKQTTNRPVEALNDMQKAIELNDNRGVYRSKLLLDEDLAARGAALGRLYNNIGFQQLGVVEGWKSVTNDPRNYSAHRLLADNYAGLPRHETARVSELLQSQLLQPVNITHVQPQLAESDLFLIGGLGPAEASLNEFNSLFAHDRFSILASGLVAGNGTYSDEVVQSGLWKNLSYSLGQFHYQTDGFRSNSDLETNIYNVFLQLGLSPQSNIQLELRHQDTESGDLRELSDPNFQLENFREDFDRDTIRLGFGLGFSPNSKLIGSLGFRKTTRDTDGPNTFDDISTLYGFDISQISHLLPTGLNTVRFDGKTTENSGIELQYLQSWNHVNVIFGGGYTYQDRKKDTQITTSPSSQLRPDLVQQLVNLGVPQATAIAFNATTINRIQSRIDNSFDEKRISHESYGNVYLYTNLEPIKNLHLTIGSTYHVVNRENSQSNLLDLSEQYILPKVGLIWSPTETTSFRAAWFQNVKWPFVSGQTIEPTHVAGFNQMFDDKDSTKSDRYGFGIDQILPMGIKIGAELSWRDASIPRFVTGLREGVHWIKQNEKTHRAYLYWTPTDHLAFAATYFFEKIKRNPRIDLDGGIPLEMSTHRIPISLGYFHPTGFSTNITATFINQNVIIRGFGNSDTDQNDKFWMLDSSISYRLPKRWGILNFGVKNILGQTFSYQEPEFDLIGDIDGELLPPTFFPDRVFFSQLTIAL